MIELVVLGFCVGILSGFFGIGGGTILVPLLLLLGYEIKTAIGIAVVQMVFSSIYGSYLNAKKGNLDINMITYIGIGGFIGALSSGYITNIVSREVLEIIFLAFAVFALIRLFIKNHEYKTQKELKSYILFLIGLPLGAISMTVGVGGSIILVPILVGFLHVGLKKAISAGLFFVIFSSIAGFISHFYHTKIDYQSGVIIGLASLFGVYIGIHFKDKVDNLTQRKLLITFYLMIVIYLAKRLILNDGGMI